MANQKNTSATKSAKNTTNENKLNKDFKYGYLVISNYMQNDHHITPIAKDIFLEMQQLLNQNRFNRDAIITRLKISKDTYNKHKNLLIKYGYLEITKKGHNKYIYDLNMVPKFEYLSPNIDLNLIEKYDMAFLQKYLTSGKATREEIKTIENYFSKLIKNAKWLDN